MVTFVGGDGGGDGDDLGGGGDDLDDQVLKYLLR